MTLYIETLSGKKFLSRILFHAFIEKLSSNPVKTHYYIEASHRAKMVVRILGKIFGLQFEELEFELRNIKDDFGELIRLRIHRLDLFKFQAKLLDSNEFKTFSNPEWLKNSSYDFILKGLMKGSINEENSISRSLFIIEVVAWHIKKNGEENCKLFFENRPWWKIYIAHAEKLGIVLKPISLINEDPSLQSYMIEKLKQFPRFFSFLKYLKNYTYLRVKDEYNRNVEATIFKENIQNNKTSKIFVFGRGDLNLTNNGHHSDFFWVFNSPILTKNILYQHASQEEKNKLKKYGFSIINNAIENTRTYKVNKIEIPTIKKLYKKEGKKIEELIKTYNENRSHWAKFFYEQGVNIYFTWYKYDHEHLAIADAVKDVGGIFAVWQMAFDGFKTIDTKTRAHLAFNFSSWSIEIGKKSQSSIDYNIISGYPKDYAAPLLKAEARKLRSKLESNGARKIVFAIDENSLDDERWHTGHILQQENYYHILEKVLETPWLGVVFKPKVAKTLRTRLGDVATLLTKAEKTGRCYVFQASGRHTTMASPLVAGLSADVCIHGHLSAGTAALECALEKLPTLLIDREGAPSSKFYELPKGKVIFKDWPEALDAVMEHFQSEKGIPGFGDWTSIIDELDPFRDGKAAYRMGNYLNQLISGFEKGLDRKAILENAAEIYAKEWGSDKIVIA